MSQGTENILHPPTPERVTLSQAPIVLAVCQVQFPAKLNIEDPIVVAKFQDRIDSIYGNMVEGNAFQISFSASFDGSSPVGAEQKTSKQWEFRDPDGVWLVRLTQTNLSLETREYTSFEDFSARMSFLVDALIQTIRPPYMTRLGVRYINEIRLASLPLVENDIIRPELLGPSIVPEPDSEITRSQSYAHFRLSELNINFQYGLFEGGTTVQPLPDEPVPVTPFVLLDFDAYKEFKDTALNSERVTTLFQKFHGAIYRMFRLAVTDEFIEREREAVDVNPNADSN